MEDELKGNRPLARQAQAYLQFSSATDPPDDWGRRRGRRTEEERREEEEEDRIREEEEEEETRRIIRERERKEGTQRRQEREREERERRREDERRGGGRSDRRRERDEEEEQEDEEDDGSFYETSNPLKYSQSIIEWAKKSFHRCSVDINGRQVHRLAGKQAEAGFKDWMAANPEYNFCVLHRKVNPSTLPLNVTAGSRENDEACNSCVPLGILRTDRVFRDPDIVREVQTEYASKEKEREKEKERANKDLINIIIARKCYEKLHEYCQEIFDKKVTLSQQAMKAEVTTKLHNNAWLKFITFEEYHRLCFETSARLRRFAGKRDVEVDEVLVQELQEFIAQAKIRYGTRMNMNRTYCHVHRQIVPALMTRPPYTYIASCGLCLDESVKDDRGEKRDIEREDLTVSSMSVPQARTLY